MSEKQAMYASLDVFISKQKELLKMEQLEEVAERQRIIENQSLKELEKKGVCVRKLRIDHRKTGLFGRHIIIFAMSAVNSNIIAHRLTPGDIVGLYTNKNVGTTNESIASGVVSFSRSTTIGVAFNDEFDTILNEAAMYRLMKLTNDVTYRRLNKALDLLGKITARDPVYRLVELLFPCTTVMEKCLNCHNNIDQFFDDKLDESQKAGVRFALNSTLPMSILHGPPGTGKTTTVVEIVQQEVKKFSKKVLVCAPSNIAVDNLVERLSKAGIKVVRLGHPARIVEEVQKFSLDAILDAQGSSDIIKSVKAEITAHFSSSNKHKGNARDSRSEVKALKKELVSRQEKAITETLKNADVVLSTTNSATIKDGPLRYLPDHHFDLLVIDEAAQAMEMSCWVPLLHVSRCILAGDHLQLPPTIISEKAARLGLATTLLERTVHGLGENAVHMLTIQYRMNRMIMQWPSDQLYHSKLIAADCVADHRLCDMPGVKETRNTTSPVVYMDTAGCNMFELEGNEDESKGNTHEVQIVKQHVIDLLNDGVRMKDVGVITPYNLQVELLRQAILPDYPKIEINSVDGFQGREKECILISLVRSNIEGEVGFLKEDRRINVAVTRARRHLFLVGDSTTISRHRFLETMCEFLFDNADLRSPRFEVDETTTTTANRSPNDTVESGLQNDFPFELQQTREVRSLLQKNARDTDKKLPAAHVTGTKKKIIEGRDNKEKRTFSKEENTQNQFTDESLERQLRDFLTSDERTLKFPTMLTSKQRAFVHETAETLQLQHKSIGEGEQRRIIITKEESRKEDSECCCSKVFAVPQAKKDETEFVEDPNLLACPVCSAHVPKMNFELHKVRCSNLQQQQKQPEMHGNNQNSSSSVKKKKSKKPSSTTSANVKGTQKQTHQEEDVDALLDHFAALNSKCHFERCKKSIKMLGQKCEHCSQVFCFSHHVAEIHGCKEAAKIKARRDIAKYHDSKPRPMNSTKKVQVQNKLSKKLSEMEDGRKKKTKDKK